MKMIEAIIQPSKLEAVKEALNEVEVVRLTISDVQGKVVKVVEGDFGKGHNTVNLKRSDFGASGVLYYRLDAGSDSATRKMILVD